VIAGRYVPYSEYQPSPVNWQGMLPTPWSSKPLKHLCRFFGGGTPSKENKAYWTGDVPWVSPKDMKRKYIDATEDSITVEAVENSSTKLIDEGALLIVVRSGILQHSIPVAINTKKVTLNQDMKALVFGDYMSVKYAYYFVEGNQKELLLDWSKQGATVESIEHEYLANAIFPTPSMGEQRTIANFLDHETAKIDTLIDKQQQLIKLLKEKRQAVISHAVTRGLNPDAPVKDSGVKWLGVVPVDWKIIPLKYLVLESAGIQMGPFGGMLLGLGENETGYKVFGQENTISGDFTKGSRWINKDRFEELSNYHLKVGDIVLTRKGSLGNARLVTELAVKGIIDSDTIRIRINSNKVQPKLMSFLMHNALYVSEQITRNRRGAILPGLNTETISNIFLLVPQPSDQNELFEYLQVQNNKFDSAVAKCISAVELLEERRTALISAAVTGKIDVRNWQPAQTEIPMEASA
jgi:type I restriction enzyme, S subunit